VAVAHALAERGVDAIVGHHPHVLQPFEGHRPQRDRGRHVPIFYSLGNLTNPFSAPYLCQGGVARLQLAKGQCAGGRRETHVADASLEGVEQVCCSRRDRISLRPFSLDRR
jgi:poly-gamma-glutamate synthesis protein (capsule biosynthesis protein)